MTQAISVATSSTLSALETINAPSSSSSPNAFAQLGQGDFLRLLTVQLQQQDPLEPVDNKEMLAQMAQFSALAGTTTTNDELATISAKLDALIDAQKAAQSAAEAAYARLGATAPPTA